MLNTVKNEDLLVPVNCNVYILDFIRTNYAYLHAQGLSPEDMVATAFEFINIVEETA